MKEQPCDRGGMGFGQRLAPHERVHELSVIEILDSVAHGRTLYPYPWSPAMSASGQTVPVPYFGGFKEIADMIVTLGQAGLQIDSSFIPDISVGKAWSTFWDENNFDLQYGDRVKWDHNYPEYFKQALSNPQPAWCYPEMAFGEFRRWLRENYIQGGRFATYINGKIKQKQLPASFAQLVISAYKLDENEV
jgi:hypothetical protein